MVLAETSHALAPNLSKSIRQARSQDDDGGGVLAWVSARQCFPLSVENKGKGHGKKTPMVQSTSHTKPTRLLASLHSWCCLGWLLLVSADTSFYAS